MKIAIAGPINLQLLQDNINVDLPPVFSSFPMASMYVKELLERGHKVIVFTLSDSVRDTFIAETGNLKIYLIPSPSHRGRRLFNVERRECIKRIKEAEPDIIHVNWSYEYAWAALESGFPSVITLHDNAGEILKYQFDMFRLIKWGINKYVLSNSKHLIANSQYIYSLLEDSYKRKTRIIPNFFPESLKKYFDSSQRKDNYILSISNGFSKFKNIGNAMIAFSKVREKFPDLEYHLVGAQMEKGGAAYRFADKNRILKGIKFLGKLPYEEVISEISAAKVLVHPSRIESFGMVVLESMLIGTPVVGGANSGNIPSILKQGEVGKLCNIEKPDKICEAILEYLNNEESAAAIRRKAHSFAVENYSLRKIADLHLDYYHDILN